MLLYTYRELSIATGGFSPANKVGEGGFGPVYKGRLKDGAMVTKKVLSAESKQGLREFMTEIIVISDIEHENLVKLEGCCVEGSHRILVYGYLENNSLAQTLLGNSKVYGYLENLVKRGGLRGAQTFAKTEKLVNLLKKQKEANRPYGAICASPAHVLEPHGLLKGKKATAFPPMCDKLSDQSEIEDRVVVDGNLITSGGPGTSMEFGLAIVEKFFGREKALELAKAMIVVKP